MTNTLRINYSYIIIDLFQVSSWYIIITSYNSQTIFFMRNLHATDFIIGNAFIFKPKSWYEKCLFSLHVNMDLFCVTYAIFKFQSIYGLFEDSFLHQYSMNCSGWKFMEIIKSACIFHFIHANFSFIVSCGSK